MNNDALDVFTFPGHWRAKKVQFAGFLPLFPPLALPF
jgi:hypothetical protein